MAGASAAAKPIRTLQAQIPVKLGFLMDMHRYKVAYGGRGGGKSWAYADALLALGAAQELRILCAREIQNSIKQSVHQLLKDRIEALGLTAFYQVLETEIRGRNGTQINFTGLASHTVDTIKSFEGVDVCWVEEAQTVPKRSWDILIPTIRAENSEIWVTFNPDMDTDEAWKRFVAQQTPPGAVVAKVNYYDNPWFPKVLEAERLHSKATQTEEDYNNTWEGMCKTVVAGAIYGREVVQAIEAGRYRPMPYDPRLPVHTIWDLGWNDAMSIIMVQKPVPTVVNVINYLEDNFKTYAEYVADLDKLGYRWGDDWLPHDGDNQSPITGKSAKQTLKDLGRRTVKIMGRGDVEEGIRNTRMVFPRVYFDNTERARDTGYLGVPRLMECLKRYRRHVPKNTGEPATPVHDQFSHGADAFRGMAQVIEQIKNPADMTDIKILPAFQNFEPSMGMLG